MRILGVKGLFSVRQDKNVAAIIFVHGLQGDPYKTWTKKGYESLPHMLSADEKYNEFDIFTFGYDTGFIFKRSEFQDIGDILCTEIEAKLTEYKTISFITHSMGGIVVQSMLTEQVERKNYKLLKRIDGIVYLAVPFLGSNVASKASFIPYLFVPPILGERMVSMQVQTLKIFSKQLAELSIKWSQYRSEELLNLKELNIYGQSDKAVAIHSARAPHIKNFKAVDEGHRSICKVDRESTVYQLIIQFHNELLEFSKKKGMNDPEIRHYLEWIKLRTDKFLVPGANLPIPIDYAWASLYIIDEPNGEVSESLEKEIARYHEWERLTARRDVKKNAQEIIELGKRIVLIGGPGSGKSTLAKRTVNRLATRGEKLIYIRLPNLSKEMEQGKSFEDALWSTALDSYQGNKTFLKEEMKDIDVLLADGLDECGPFQKRVSQALHDWLIGRENTRVIVTTRPVGYDPSYFNTFSHVEILPLEEKEIEAYSLKLLNVLNKEDKPKALKMHKDFQQQLKSNKMLNVASRSPLLLNFLILLLVSGNAFGNYRADLYRKILDESLKQIDRGKEINLDEQIALRSIEYIGWILQNALEGKNERSDQYILNQLSIFIRYELDCKPLIAKQLANSCLQFWVEIGILEYIKVGYVGGYTFVHLTLGEYAAGKYINSMPKEEQTKIFLEKIHIPIWRETLLLASGLGSTSLFVETILEKVKEKTDLYNDIAFAASMLSESAPIKELNEKVAERALKSLTTPYPSICYEVGSALEGIAQQEPDWLFVLISPLLKHDQDWTKLIAYKLALLTKKHIVNINTINILVSIKPTDKFILKDLKSTSGWVIWNATLELAMINALNNEISNEELSEIMLKLKDSSFNARFHLNISKLLREKGKIELLEIFENKYENIFEKFDLLSTKSKFINGEKALFESILRQIPVGTVPSLNKEMALIEVSKFCHSIGYGDRPIFDLNSLVDNTNTEVIDEVIKGVLLVYELDQKKLFYEIQWLLNNDDVLELLFSRLPDIIIPEPNWEKAKNTLQKDLLIQSMSHPSETIASNGTLLLSNCFDIIDVQESFMTSFMKTKDNSLFYFTLAAEYILEEEKAFDIILDHLEKGLYSGSHYLYKSMKNLPRAKSYKSVESVLMKGIKSNDPLIVKSAAITKFQLCDNNNENEILEIVSYWDKEGVFCERDKIKVVGGYCPKCRVVPESPLPELIRLLKKSKIFDIKGRIYFSEHPRLDVAEVSLGTLTYYLEIHTEDISELIRDIKNGVVSSNLLKSIFKINIIILKPFAEELFSLIESNEDKVRKALIEALTTGQWFEIEKSIPTILRALKDESVNVRNQAVATYRILELSEEV